MPRIFIETDVLVSALDRRDKKRQKKCRDLLKTLKGENQGVISTQVLQEFFIEATTRMKLEPLQTKAILRSLENFEVVTINPELISEAIDCSILNQLTFAKSLDVVCAERANCDVLWTKNIRTQSCKLIRGVEIQAPY